MDKPSRILKGQPNRLSLKRHLRAKLTPAESRLWSKLRSKQFLELTFRRQHGIGPYIAEFFVPGRNWLLRWLGMRKGAFRKKIERGNDFFSP